MTVRAGQKCALLSQRQSTTVFLVVAVRCLTSGWSLWRLRGQRLGEAERKPCRVASIDVIERDAEFGLQNQRRIKADPPVP